MKYLPSGILKEHSTGLLRSKDFAFISQGKLMRWRDKARDLRSKEGIDRVNGTTGEEGNNEVIRKIDNSIYESRNILGKAPEPGNLINTADLPECAEGVPGRVERNIISNSQLII